MKKETTIKDQDKWYRAGWKDGERETREEFIKELEGLKIKSSRPTDKRVENPVWNNGWNELAIEINQKLQRIIEKYKKVH